MRRVQFGDPATILEHKQNGTCLGCAQLVVSRWAGTKKYVCNKAVQKASLDVYEMKRCRKYTEGVFMTREQSEQIEELLSIWYRWQIRQSHAEQLAHFYRPTDHTCREYETPQTEQDEAEAADLWVENQTGEQMQLCIDVLPIDHRAAISTSMRNKESGRAVWSSARAGEQHATYQAAKDRLFPMIVARNLICAAVSA